MPTALTLAKFLFVLMLALGLSACVSFTKPDDSDKSQSSRQGQPAHSAVEYFGNVSNAGDDPNNFLMVGDDASFSYNNERGTLNWPAWKTTDADLGDR